MTATLQQLIERAVVSGRVDETAGVIRDVRIIGQHSRNNRRYTERALRNAADKYEGVKVYIDHPEQAGDRSFHSWAGNLRNVRYRDGALYGDIQLRRKGEHYESIIEAAQSFSSHFGLSHVANGETRLDSDGTEIVDEITEVHSVDIVTDPATNRGLYESSLLIEELVRKIEREEARCALLESGASSGDVRSDWIRESYGDVLSKAEQFAAAAGSEEMLATAAQRKAKRRYF